MSTTIFVVSGTTFPAPGDWPGTADSVEVIGAGGGGSYPLAHVGSGGGGGAYSKDVNVAAVNGCALQVGAGGAGGVSGSSSGGAGTDTWFNGATLAASLAGAKGGA